MYPSLDLSISSLGYAYEQGRLFDNLSFSCVNNQCLHIVGPNGAGKTTLLKLLLGILRPQDGEITLNQQNIFKQLLFYKSQTLYFGHSLALKMTLSPAENLAFFFPTVSHLQIREALESLSLSPLQQDTPVMYLSAGQQRRVHLARLYLAKEPIWVLDEPLTTLDHFACAWLQRVCEAHCNQGGILIVTSHQPLLWNIPLIRLELANESA